MVATGGQWTAEKRSRMGRGQGVELRCPKCGERETLRHRYWECGWLYSPSAPAEVVGTSVHLQQVSCALDEGVAPCLWLRAVPPKRYEGPPEALVVAEREWAGAAGVPSQEGQDPREGCGRGEPDEAIEALRRMLPAPSPSSCQLVTTECSTCPSW